MKTKTSILDKIAVLLFLVLLTMASLCFGEIHKTVTGHKSNLIENMNNTCVLVSFKAKTVDNKTYINWKTISSMSNFYFVLERSTDGNTYSVVDMKKGYLSPKDQPLLYSYIDETTSAEVENTIYYRIKMYQIDAASDNRKMLMLSHKNLFEGNENAWIMIPNTTNELVQNF